MLTSNFRITAAFISIICSTIASAQEIPKKRTIIIHKAQEKIKNKSGEVRCRVAHDPFFVAKFEDAAKKQDYRHRDTKNAKFGDPDLEIPSVRYVADVIFKKSDASRIRYFRGLPQSLKLMHRPRRLGSFRRLKVES